MSEFEANNEFPESQGYTYPPYPGPINTSPEEPNPKKNRMLTVLYIQELRLIKLRGPM